MNSPLKSKKHWPTHFIDPDGDLVRIGIVEAIYIEVGRRWFFKKEFTTTILWKDNSTNEFPCRDHRTAQLLRDRLINDLMRPVHGEYSAKTFHQPSL